MRGESIDSLSALLAGGAATVAVYAHGVLGHRWFTAQLRSVELRPTSMWGDGDVARRVFGVAWHIVTALFSATAVALYLVAFGAVESRELLRFISILYAVLIGVGLVYLAKRPQVFLRPLPLIAVASLVSVSVLAWLAST